MPRTLDQLLHATRTRLQAAGIDNSGFEARLLLGAALDLSAPQLIAHGADPVSDAQQAAVDALVARREAGEPVAHILGRRGFWTLELGVSPACLIPRPETELLVEQALAAIDASGREQPRVLDLGTGSGAIILALKTERPQIQAVASDRSLHALYHARANARDHRLEVLWLAGEWLAPLNPEYRFDVIVSNPPYIAPDDPHLTRGDLRFEPATALVAADRGLADLQQIIDDARAHLRPGGMLLLEHGWDQAAAVRTRLAAAGYQAITSHRDTAGHERITAARRR